MFLKRNAVKNKENIFQALVRMGMRRKPIFFPSKLLVNIFSFFSFFFFASKINMEGNFNFLCVRRSEKGGSGTREKNTFCASHLKRFFFHDKAEKLVDASQPPLITFCKWLISEISFPWYRSQAGGIFFDH